jgi:hypothetical protein
MSALPSGVRPPRGKGTAATGAPPGAGPTGRPGRRDVAAEEVVGTFGTGLAETVITLRAGAVVWRRRPGPDVRADPTYQPRPVPRDFARRAAAASSDQFAFAIPEDTAGAYTWTAPGRSSAARLLTGSAGEAERAAAVAGLLGQHLQAFHRLGAAASPRDYPPLLYASRLVAWMRTGSGPRAAAAWHDILLRGLGQRRWGRLAGYAHETLTTRAPATTVVGWATLGSVVVPDADDAAPPPALLCGDQGCVAAPETDIGCLLGEIHELQDVLTRRGSPTGHMSAWRTALLRGYGPHLDTARAARTAVVRVAAHTHDFAAFVGFHIDLHAYVGLLAGLLDSEGTQTMTG